MPAAPPPSPIPIGSATAVGYAIRTFRPQARIVSQMLRQAVGVESDAEILSALPMRRPCVLGTLQMIYSAVSVVVGDSPALSVHADMYRNLYRRTLRSMAVDLDTNGDGVADMRRSPGLICLIRS